MKQRVISGIIIVLITAVVVLAGGYLFKAAALLIGLRGAYEFLSTRNHKINWLEYAIMVLFIIALNIDFSKAVGFVIVLLIVLIAMAVFDEKASFDEICVTFVESVMLGFALHYMVEIETISKWLFAYIMIIVYLTDVFALFTGMKFGKHKLNERVSPKKTIEGAIGGWACGAIVSFVYAIFFNFFAMNPWFILVCSITLPVVSQVGDLAFSLIKRHYKIKDFSNLIPGHGGLMDRLDSLTFVLLFYGALTVFVGIIYK